MFREQLHIYFVHHTNSNSNNQENIENTNIMLNKFLSKYQQFLNDIESKDRNIMGNYKIGKQLIKKIYPYTCENPPVLKIK